MRPLLTPDREAAPAPLPEAGGLRVGAGIEALPPSSSFTREHFERRHVLKQLTLAEHLLCATHLHTFLFKIYFYFFIFIFIVIQLQLSAFSPHPSTPPQPNPPPSPASTLPLDFVHVSFIVVLVIPTVPSPVWLLLDYS